MPIILTESEAPQGGRSQVELAFVSESGELTLAGTVAAEFLESADFSELFEHPEAQPYILSLVDEDAGLEEEVLPGSIAIKLMDEADLDRMFLFYLDALGENAQADGGTMEDKAKLAVFENAYLKPIGEKFKRGAFRALAEGQKGIVKKLPRAGQRAAMAAMVTKGVLKRTKNPRKYTKGAAYGDGTTAGKTAWSKHQRQNKSSIARGKKTAVRKRSNVKLAAIKKGKGKRSRALAASVGMEEGFDMGFQEPYSGALFAVGVVETALVEFAPGEFERIQKSIPLYADMKLVEGKGGFRAPDADDEKESDDSADETNESVEAIGRTTFADANGRPDLSEGASIAASVGRVMGFAKKQPVTKPLDG